MDVQAGQEAPGSTHTNARDAMSSERARMMQELNGLQQRWEARLANQRQVIENLDTARKQALDHIGELHEFLDDLLDNVEIPDSRALKARQLLGWEQ